jgi:hypothetical protein
MKASRNWAEAHLRNVSERAWLTAPLWTSCHYFLDEAKSGDSCCFNNASSASQIHPDARHGNLRSILSWSTWNSLGPVGTKDYAASTREFYETRRRGWGSCCLAKRLWRARMANRNRGGAERGIMKPTQIQAVVPTLGKDSPQEASAFAVATAGSDRRPRRRSNLTFRDIEGETVVLDREGGFIHQLNPTASLIWAHCDGTSTVTRIANRLVATYDIDSRTALDDVEAILAEFRKLDLMESVLK